MVKHHWPFPELPGKVWHFGSGFTLAAVASISKLILSLNRVQVHGKERLLDALDNRDPKRGLITFSNHYACADDPLLWSMLPWRHLSPSKCRWAFGAAEICFTKEYYAVFFGLGKVVPVVRGAGVYQRCVDFMMDKLERGEWVHIFPEARVNQEHRWLRLKWGIGRMVAETTKTPLVLPFFHQGMDSVQANLPPYAPNFGQKVTVLVGSPLDFEAKVKDMRKDNIELTEQRRLITEDVQSELKRIRYETEALHAARL